MQKLKTTHKVWNLSPLFKNDNDPEMEKEKKRVEEESYKFINKWKAREDYLKDPLILKTALDEYENLQRFYGTKGKIGYYFDRRSSQEQDNPNVKAKSAKIEDFGEKIFNDIRFFAYKIAKIPEKEQKKFLSHEKLKEYKHLLEGLFENAKYLLSEPEEKILTLTARSGYYNWVSMVSEFLSKEEQEVVLEDGKKAKINYSQIRSLLDSKNKKTRDSAADAFNNILSKHVDTAENEINSILQNKKINDDLRGIERPDLTRHISDDIDSEVVDTLLSAVSSRNDISKRFYKLKAKLLGVKKLEYHERNVEYGNIDKEYSYDDSVNLIYKTFSNLDTEFAEIFKMFVEDGAIDVYPKKGKGAGAYCAHSLITQPTYILLNHTDKLNDVLTIAHEAGHGINNELIKKKQNALNFETALSTAEVASTFMEDFVLQDLLKSANDELKLSILMMKLNSDVSTIFRQVACYMFEQELHKKFREKGYLSKEEIGKIFQKHMEAYMGDFVEQSEGSENWWVYWSHIRYFFYVYSYASGLLISKSMQNSVKKDAKFVEKVKDFLSVGTSESPKDSFAKMGIDIKSSAFWNKGLDEIETLLGQTENLAKKLGKTS